MTTEARKVITQLTREHLEREIAKLRAKLIEASSSDGSDHRSSQHDDAGHENDKNNTRGLIGAYEQALDGTDVIIPAKLSENVGLGNDVVLRFEGETSNERLTLLGPVDTAFSPNKAKIMSVDSPVGSALIGRKRGEMIVATQKQVGEQPLVIRVRLIDVLPGDETCFFPPKQ